MQTVSIPAPYPPTHPPIQNGYQPLTESEIYAIKRQYLGLLPPPQVIDICLTFEAHAPLHVKSTVWPYDIRAAIAAIHAQNAQNPPPAQQSTGDQSMSKDLPSDAGEKATPSPSDQPQSTAPDPSVTNSITNSVPSGNATTPPVTHLHQHQHPHPLPQQLPPPVPHPHYPHQPYYHPSYPHAPYYPVPPPAHFSFPHPFPSFPHPPQTQYQQNIPPPPPPNHPPPLFTTAPLTHPPHPSDSAPSNPVDDLPSYEEMIVEALIDSGDPDGCAPKALFSWMASHYPLQSNFRPSASQALQKAFKRGRLEKGSNGRYRLNSNWEGGNTSKRTTRRPQTNAQTALSSHQGHPSSPFTHVPLIHDSDAGASSSQPHPSAQGGQAGHSFSFGFQGPPTSAISARPLSGPLEIPEGQVREGSDAWEAAQNILKAINFGQLFQMSGEDGMVMHADNAAVAQPPVFASSVETPLTHDGQVAAAFVGASHPSRNAETLLRTELSGDERAALQAQLALLAAQLAEFADVGEDELAHDLRPLGSSSEDHVTATSSESQNNINPAHPPADPIVNDDDDDDDDMDMVEVSVPMASLTA